MKTIIPVRFLLLLCAVLFSAAAGAADKTILVWGDSISAGFGLDADTGWVHLLEQRLQSQGSAYNVVNASDKVHPDIVLIELGGNDGLRAQSLEAMRANLDKMLDLSAAARARPVLFEMYIPPNYGPVYAGRFTKVFDELAQQHKVPLVPFFLASLVGERDRWFQDDGIHPNAQAQPQLLEAVWPTLAPLLQHATHP
jgi:acyl-CoA thioesterase-1